MKANLLKIIAIVVLASLAILTVGWCLFQFVVRPFLSEKPGADVSSSASSKEKNTTGSSAVGSQGTPSDQKNARVTLSSQACASSTTIPTGPALPESQMVLENRTARIMEEILKENSAEAENLMDEGPFLVGRRFKGQETLLHVACSKGLVSVIAKLIDMGADMNSVAHLESTPLVCATRHYRPEAVRILINKGVDVNSTEPDNMRAFHNACELGYLEIVKILGEKINDINVKNQSRYVSSASAPDSTGIHFATQSGGKIEFVRYLIEKGADPHIENSDFISPYHYAQSGSEWGYLDIFDQLQ